MSNNKIKYIVGLIIFILAIVGLSRIYNLLNSNMQNSEPKNEITQSVVLNEAKDFTIYNDKNEEIAVSSFKGKPIVMNFWTTWCVYCKVEMDYFQELYNQYKDDVHFLMINATLEDNKQAVSDYIKEQGYTFPVYYDTKGKAITTYKITGYPVTVFINKDFQITRTHKGMINKETLQQNIDNIL